MVSALGLEPTTHALKGLPERKLNDLILHKFGFFFTAVLIRYVFIR